MSLCTYNLKSACCLRCVIKLNIRTTACHIGRNRDRTMLARLSNYLCLKLMELGIKYIVLYSFLFE